MSKATREAFEAMKSGSEPEKSMGVMDALGAAAKEVGGMVADGVQAVLDAAYSPGVQNFVEHGCQEGANALFGNGQTSGFVLYQREGVAGKDEPGVHGEKAPEA